MVKLHQTEPNQLTHGGTQQWPIRGVFHELIRAKWPTRGTQPTVATRVQPVITYSHPMSSSLGNTQLCPSCTKSDTVPRVADRYTTCCPSRVHEGKGGKTAKNGQNSRNVRKYTAVRRCTAASVCRCLLCSGQPFLANRSKLYGSGTTVGVPNSVQQVYSRWSIGVPRAGVGVERATPPGPMLMGGRRGQM